MREEVLARLGARLSKTRELADRLTDSISADAGGFPFFANLRLEGRAVVSDQVVGAARAIEVNFAEARIHESNRAKLGEGGFGLPVTPEDHERGIRYDAEGVAFFRAVGSSLDCIAAVCVGLLRLPSSIRQASFRDVLSTDPARAPDEILRRLWSGLQELVRHEGNDPSCWLAWTLEMRHALMHRGRQMNMLIPRPTPPPLVALPHHVATEVARERFRADSHFRTKPWLPDMRHLADAKDVASDAILREPADVTVRGIADALARLLERCSGWLLDSWESIEDPDIPLPAWEVKRAHAIDFRGFIPDHELPPMSAMLVSPRDAERVRLAMKLRDAAAVDEAS